MHLKIVDRVKGPSEKVVEECGGVVRRVGIDETEGGRDVSSTFSGEEVCAPERGSACEVEFGRVRSNSQEMG